MHEIKSFETAAGRMLVSAPTLADIETADAESRAFTKGILRLANRVLLVALIILTGCRAESAREALVAIGVVDPLPPPARLVEVICDASEYSSCTSATLRSTVDDVLPVLAGAPGSRLRVWNVGGDLGDIRPVASLDVSPPKESGPAARRNHEKRWMDESRRVIDAASLQLFAKDPLRRSRLAEALGQVSRADNPDGLPRTIILISDRLEESEFGHFECRQLPTTAAFIKGLHAAGVLPQGSLRETNVILSYGNTSRHRCPSLARDAKVQELWTAAISAAGGKPTFYQERNPF